MTDEPERLTQLIEAVWCDLSGSRLSTQRAHRLATEIIGDGYRRTALPEPGSEEETEAVRPTIVRTGTRGGACLARPPRSPGGPQLTQSTPLPVWMDTEDARDNRAEGLDQICEECGLPFWACQAAATEAFRRGSINERVALDAEARTVLGIAE